MIFKHLFLKKIRDKYYFMQYLTDLTVMKKSDLLILRGLGKTSLEELAEVMVRYGLQFVD